MALQNALGNLACDATLQTTRDNVATAVTRLEAIRDRLPSALNADGGVLAHITNLPATQPVSGTVAVSGTVPVSVATNTPDVTDRSGRLLGHVTVDSAPTTAVTAASLPLPAGAAKDSTLTDGTQRVGGTVAVSAASLPLPTGAAQDGTDITSPTAMPTGGAGVRGWLSAIWTKLNGSLAVTGTFWQSTQPVSLATNTPDVTDRSARLLGHVTVDTAPTTAITAASLPLPSGAAQDGTLTGGTAKAINRGGAKGATTAADVTSTAEGTDHQALDVQTYHGGAAINPQTIRALTSADVVTATQGTAAAAGSPWSIRLSDGAAFYNAPTSAQLPASLGQKVAASSLGVVLASDQAAVPVSLATAPSTPVTGTFWQATQPVSLATNTPDVTDRAAREVGRARLWDGTDEATVIPRGTAATSSDKGLAVVSILPRLPTYQVVTAEITSGTSIATAQNLTLWHPSALAKDVYIVEIGVNVRVVQTAGTFAWELQFFTAEGGTPGGTAITPQPLNLGDASSGLTVRTSPTGAVSTTGQTFQRASFPLPAAATPLVGPGNEALILYRAQSTEDAVTLRSGQGDGLLIRQNIIATLTTAPIFTIYVRFVERA